MVRIIADGILCFFLVVRPMQANLLSAIATRYPISTKDKSILLYVALQSDPCEESTMRFLAEAYVDMNEPKMAAVVYRDAVNCSPGNSMARFNFGSILFAIGLDGTKAIEDAIRLEPNNAFYQQQYRKLMALKK